MLEYLAIQNYQCLGRSTVELSPGITVFVGPNDKGKSAHLRVLRWLALNLPAGDKFIKRGAKGAIAVLGVDGKTIKRRRGPGVNDYHLDDQTYVAFGAGVPDPITQVLQIGPCNFQRQLDDPFWFTLSPGGLARELNTVVDLEIIDRAQAAAAKQIKAAAARAEYAAAELQAATAEMEKWSWAPKAAAAYEAVIKAAKRADAVVAKAEDLGGLLAGMEARREDAENASQNARALAGLAAKAQAAGRARQAANALGAKLGALRQASHNSRLLPSREALGRAYEAHAVVSVRAFQLKVVLDELKKRAKFCEHQKNEAEHKRHEYHESVGGICPLCGSQIERSSDEI